MALDPLATVADLAARGVRDGELEVALGVASAAIRDAAGVPISEVTATISTVTPISGHILPLPGPVTAVTEVTVDGDVVDADEYRNLGNGLWRRCGWGREPLPVTVEGTFGLAEVPADVVDLTCQLAKAWLDHVAAGGGSVAGLKSVKIDDASETYTDEAAGQVSAAFLPKVTRDWLAARFSGGVFVVEVA